MALYKYGNLLVKSDHEAFDVEHLPGSIVPDSGIYRCTNCGDEDACNKRDPFPPQNHRQHNPTAGLIRWKLLVFAQQKA
jgi:hypothetical protein